MENNLYIADFFDKLCRNRHDANGTDLAKEALRDLRSVASADDYGQILHFDHAVRSFDAMMDGNMVDLDDPEVQAKISKYEKLIATTPIHSDNKIALYNALLEFLSFNKAGNSRYFDVLLKKINLVTNGNDDQLQICYKQASFFAKGVDREKYLRGIHDIYTKAADKKKFRNAATELGLVLDPVKNKLVPEKKLTPGQRHYRLSVILELIKTQLPLEKQTELMEEALTLSHANNLSRSNNFEIKRNLCALLQKNYYAMGNHVAGNQKGLDYRKWDAALTQTMVRGHERHDRDF